MDFNAIDSIVVLLIILLALFIGLIIIWFVIDVCLSFNDQCKSIMLEMERSETREEYDFWKSCLIRLYLEHIPIVNLFVHKNDDD